MSNWMSIGIYLVAFIGMFYVLIYLPRKMQNKRHNEMMDNLKPGDRVLTVSGIYGTVTRIAGTSIFVEIADGVEVEFINRAIAQVEGYEEKPDINQADAE